MLPQRLNLMYISRTVMTQTLRRAYIRTLTSIRNRYGAVVVLCLSTELRRQSQNGIILDLSAVIIAVSNEIVCWSSFCSHRFVVGG